MTGPVKLSTTLTEAMIHALRDEAAAAGDAAMVAAADLALVGDHDGRDRCAEAINNARAAAADPGEPVVWVVQ